jgi:hypothetical protein
MAPRRCLKTASPQTMAVSVLTRIIDPKRAKTSADSRAAAHATRVARGPCRLARRLGDGYSWVEHAGSAAFAFRLAAPTWTASGWRTFEVLVTVGPQETSAPSGAGGRGAACFSSSAIMRAERGRGKVSFGICASMWAAYRRLLASFPLHGWDGKRDLTWWTRCGHQCSKTKRPPYGDLFVTFCKFTMIGSGHG